MVMINVMQCAAVARRGKRSLDMIDVKARQIEITAELGHLCRAAQ